MPPTKPTPRPSALTEPFWDAAREQRLVVQRCQACQYYNHPPRPVCDNCSSDQLEFEPVSGRGTVYSYSLMHQKTIAGFGDEVPYLVVVVELEEQPGLFMLTNLPGARVEDVQIGQPVEVTFQPFADDVILPQFRLAAGGA